MNVSVQNSQILPRLQVVVSDDKLSAYLHFTPQAQAATLGAPLPLEKESTKEVSPLREEDVYELLRQENVTHGILPDAIRSALSQTGEQTVLIAQGTEPVLGVEENVEEFFSSAVERNRYTERDGRINYREHQIIPQVKSGDLLAKIKPAILGRPGYSVTGDVIPAPPLRPLKILAKTGVNIVDGSVFAAIDGRPVIEGDRVKYYSVVRQFVHNEDVSIQTGNLTFTGDVVVNGNIYESMSVIASGNITINGDVDNANIQAGQGITIKGSAQGSTITAACGAAAFINVAEKVTELNDAVHLVLKKLSFFKERTGHSHAKELGKVILLIIEKEFPYLSGTFERVAIMLEKELKMFLEIPQIITEIIERMRTGLSQLRQCPECSTGDVLDFIKGVRFLSDYFKAEHAPLGNIVIENVNRCQIQANGNVSIIGEECFHTNIHAMYIIASCVVRGGTITATEGIEVQNVGSPFGIVSTLRVPSDKYVKIGHAYENTVVYIGERKYHFLEQKNNVKLYTGKQKYSYDG